MNIKIHIFCCRSHFHQVFIPKLLSAALKEYTASHSPGGGGGDTFVMTPTVVHVLTYLSLQHSQEVKNNLLAMFHVSEAVLALSYLQTKDKKISCFEEFRTKEKFEPQHEYVYQDWFQVFLCL